MSDEKKCRGAVASTSGNANLGATAHCAPIVELPAGRVIVETSVVRTGGGAYLVSKPAAKRPVNAAGAWSNR